MKRILIDDNWLFHEGPLEAMYLNAERNAKTVSLPHDFSIAKPPKKDCPEGDACGYLAGGLGTYMRYFNADTSLAEGRVLLELDGAYCNSEVTINGHQVGMHPYGYTPWCFDLSSYVKEGNNRVAVFVGNMGRNSRWYTGTGIYRHAYLRTGGKVHLSPSPAFLYTQSVRNKTAFVCAEVYAENHTEQQKIVRARVCLYADRGKGIPREENYAGLGETDIFIPPHAKRKGFVRMEVKNVSLWDLASPSLYRAEIVLSEGEEKIDEDELLFGIRTLSLSRQEGLLLNGKPVKLKGGCIHHDNGILGAASFYDAEYRRLKLHKENGFNAVRCAHNPMSSDFMEACDRLGLLVIAEAFDMWEMQKNANDYHLYFPDWWERDLTAFLERDRNHPSIFCWSIGNEIVERNGLGAGADVSYRLAEKVRSLDPTRYITSGIPIPFNGLPDEDMAQSVIEFEKEGSIANVQNKTTSFWQRIFLEKTKAFSAPLDIVGYNYLDMRYESDLAADPWKFICGTESFPEQIAEIWPIVERNPRALGDFVWTSWDYLGEVWIGKCYGEEESSRMQELYPSRAADCACFDITGNERPALAFHRIAWGSRETFISVHRPEDFGKKFIKSQWAWDGSENIWYFPGQEGKMTKVDVYSSAHTAELIINGKSIGKKKLGTEKKYVASFDVLYQPGVVIAVSYDEQGQKVSEQTLKTPGDVVGIHLRQDRERMPADGQSLAFISVELVDEEGNVVPVKDRRCYAEVIGEGALIAFGSAAPVTEEVYTQGVFTSYRGRLLAVVRAGKGEGEIEIKVSCDGLESAVCKIITER